MGTREPTTRFLNSRGEINTVSLLAELLAGDIEPTDALQVLLEGRVQEGPYIEYKHGAEFNKETAARDFRKYVSGFANRDGGIYVVGVKNITLEVTGASVPGGGDFAGWAARSLTDIAYGFSPPPQYSTVEHRDGTVFLAATHAAPNLISVLEEGRLVYYMRFGDQTLPTPEGLIADILLGRRSRPVLRMVSCRIVNPRGSGDRHIEIDFDVLVENEGLAWGDDVRAGVVAWMPGGPDPNVSIHLRSHLHATRPALEGLSADLFLRHRRNSHLGGAVLDPFGSRTFRIQSINVPMPTFGPRSTNFNWAAALYLLAKHTPPVWYQIRLSVYRDQIFPIPEEQLQFELLSGKVPAVAIS